MYLCQFKKNYIHFTTFEWDLIWTLFGRIVPRYIRKCVSEVSRHDKRQRVSPGQYSIFKFFPALYIIVQAYVLRYVIWRGGGGYIDFATLKIGACFTWCIWKYQLLWYMTELLKSRILEYRISDIFKENYGHFWFETKFLIWD